MPISKFEKGEGIIFTTDYFDEMNYLACTNYNHPVLFSSLHTWVLIGQIWMSGYMNAHETPME